MTILYIYLFIMACTALSDKTVGYSSSKYQTQAEFKTKYPYRSNLFVILEFLEDLDPVEERLDKENYGKNECLTLLLQGLDALKETEDMLKKMPGDDLLVSNLVNTLKGLERFETCLQYQLNVNDPEIKHLDKHDLQLLLDTLTAMEAAEDKLLLTTLHPTSGGRPIHREAERTGIRVPIQPGTRSSISKPEKSGPYKKSKHNYDSYAPAHKYAPVAYCLEEAESLWTDPSNRDNYDGRTLTWKLIPDPLVVHNAAEYNAAFDGWDKVATWKGRTINGMQIVQNGLHYVTYEVDWAGSTSKLSGRVLPQGASTTFHHFNCHTNTEQVWGDFGGLLAFFGAYPP